MSHRRPSKKGPPTKHEAPAHRGVWRPGATCADCTQRTADNRARVWSRPPLVGTVPGGSKDTQQVQFERNFETGLDDYRTARADGIQPDHSTKDSVDKAHKRIKSQEAALRKIKKFSDIDGVMTTPGVDRDVS